VAVLLLSSSTLVSCASDDEAMPAECAEPPVQMHLERADYITAGGPSVKVIDGIAQSLPFLRGEQARHVGSAQVTAMTPRIYNIYLADFPISLAKATSRTGDVVNAFDGLLGTVTLKPEAGTALRSGQVLHPEADATGSPSGEGVVSFSVEYRDGDPGPTFPLMSQGRVKIVHLDQRTLCADIALHQTYRGHPTVEIEGTVRLPIVEAGTILACPSGPESCTGTPVS
jgi:hypothetical protein